MDATTGSASGTGFDAALKALDELENDVALAREAAPSEFPSIAPESPASSFALIATDDAEAAPTSSLAIAIDEVPAAAGIGMIILDAEPEPAIVEPAVAAEIAEPEAAILPERSSPTPEAVAATLSEPASAGEAAGDHAVAAPPAPPAKRNILPMLAVGLGLLASAMAGAGLLVVSRTVNGAALVVADARERSAQAKQVQKLVGELDAIRERQLVLLQRQQQIVAAAPLSVHDLDLRLAAFKGELAAQDQSAKVLANVHEGQSELNETIIAIGMKVARMEAKLDGAH